MKNPYWCEIYSLDMKYNIKEVISFSNTLRISEKPYETASETFFNDTSGKNIYIIFKLYVIYLYT